MQPGTCVKYGSLKKAVLPCGEPSVVIFTSFAEVAKRIHGQLSSNGWDGELLTGETPQKKRQAMVDKFQVGSKTRIRFSSQFSEHFFFPI